MCLYLVITDYMDKFSTEAFEKLVLETVEFIGKDWRFLARWLFSSIDEADRIIRQIEYDYQTQRLKELPFAVLSKWKQAYGNQGTWEQLLAALDQLQWRSVIDQTQLFGKCNKDSLLKVI